MKLLGEAYVNNNRTLIYISTCIACVTYLFIFPCGIFLNQYATLAIISRISSTKVN